MTSREEEEGAGGGKIILAKAKKQFMFLSRLMFIVSATAEIKVVCHRQQQGEVGEEGRTRHS